MSNGWLWKARLGFIQLGTATGKDGCRAESYRRTLRSFVSFS